MKFAIMLIFGMVSCFDMVAADGASDISALSSNVQSINEKLQQYCQSNFSEAKTQMETIKNTKSSEINEIIASGLQTIQANIDSRYPLIRRRSQCCHTDAQRQLEGRDGPSTLQKLQACVYTGQSTLNANKPDSVIRGGDTLINKLNDYLRDPTPDKVQSAQQDFDNFKAEATTAFNKCSTSVTNVVNAAKTCFE